MAAGLLGGPGGTASAGLLSGAGATASARTGAAAAASTPTTGAAPATQATPGPAVENLRASTADRAGLTEAYASARHIPGSSVAVIRPGSLHLARVAGTGVTWAVAGFTPSPAAGLLAQVGFQDGASTGVFTRVPGQPWQLVQPSAAPGTCATALPAAVRAAWHLTEPADCGTSIQAQKGAASRALPAAGSAGTVAQSIARIALSQVGVGDTPPVQSFSGVDCDPYSTLVGPATPNSDGCGYDQTFGVENENEEWCSDFAKWVWEQAGVTADMNTINAGSDSFYDWGLGQGETMPADSGSPQVGDAVVFFPPGTITPSTYADHVGIVTAVNAGGTLNLVNGDFLATSNTTVQYDPDVILSTWAPEVWSPGEQWVFVAPPGIAQKPVPHAAVSGPRVAVAGTAADFAASAAEPGGSISQYLWTFGAGGTANGRTATATGRTASHVFTNAGLQTVTMTASSSLGTVTTRTWNVDVVSASSAATTTPSDAVWYSTVPVDDDLFLRTAAGGLAEDSWDGASWLRQDLPGTLGPSSGLTALNYADASGALEPHVFFRSASGKLAQADKSGGTWATETLAGDPAPGATIVATTTAGAPQLPTAEVFYIDQAGQPAETHSSGTGWVSRTLPGPATGHTALALAEVADGGRACVRLYYVSGRGSLTVTSPGGCAPVPAPVLPRTGISPSSPLAALSTGPDGTAGGSTGQSVFFTDGRGRLAVATSGPLGIRWRVRELPGTPAGSLLATTYLLPSGSPGEEVFYRTPSGQPAVTYPNGSAWDSATLPGTATAILGAASDPSPGQPERVFLADGSEVTEGSAGSPAGPWTAAALPATAATFAGRVVVYAATPADDQAGLAAARSAGLPASQVTQSFATAWADTLSGDYLVIAAGQAAAAGLYFNACGWANPSGAIADSTPFYIANAPLDRLPGADAYEAAAAAGTAQTAQLATDLAYYAVHGQLPAGVTALPAAAAPAFACSGEPSP